MVKFFQRLPELPALNNSTCLGTVWFFMERKNHLTQSGFDIKTPVLVPLFLHVAHGHSDQKILAIYQLKVEKTIFNLYTQSSHFKRTFSSLKLCFYFACHWFFVGACDRSVSFTNGKDRGCFLVVGCGGCITYKVGTLPISIRIILFITLISRVISPQFPIYPGEISTCITIASGPTESSSF